jgi:hypothetical protein
MPGQEQSSDPEMAEEKEEDDFSDKDETDDQIDDVEADGEDDEEGDFGADTDAEGEGDVEDRVQDLEDALEDLKAEFEQLMAGEEGEEVIDLTGKPDEEVIKHFELMEPADEIEIVQTPEGGLQININPSSKEGSEEEVPADDAEVPAEDADELKEGNVDEYGDEQPMSTKDAVKQQFGESDDEMIKEEEPVFEIEISEEDLNEVAKEATAHIVNKGGSTPDGVSKLEEPTKENGIVKNAATKHVTSKGGSVPTGEKKLEEPTKVGGVIKNAATKDIHESTKAENTNKEKELHESLVVMRKKYQEVVAENNIKDAK